MREERGDLFDYYTCQMTGYAEMCPMLQSGNAKTVVLEHGRDLDCTMSTTLGDSGTWG